MSLVKDLTITSTVRLPSGYEIPRLGFGVYKNVGEECYQACAVALEAGYRHIDTAQFYHNEQEVSKAVRDNKLGLKREDIFITSKINFLDGRHSDYASASKKIDESLAALDVDYIDLYLVHSAHGGKELRLATYKALADAQKSGKIRTIGVSNYNIPHLEEIRAAGLPTPSVNQLELHPFCQQRQIGAYCAEHGIVVQAYSPLMRGVHKEPVLDRIAESHSKSSQQVLIRWSLEKGFIPLPKSATPSRIIANKDVYDFALTVEDISAIDALDAPLDEQGRTTGTMAWNPIYLD